MTGQVGAVGEVEVEAAIAVVVEEGGSGTEGFDVVVFAGKAVVVDEVDASGGSSVGEMHWRCWRVFRGTGAEGASEGETPYLVSTQSGEFDDVEGLGPSQFLALLEESIQRLGGFGGRHIGLMTMGATDHRHLIH